MTKISEKWTLAHHYHSIHPKAENSSREESLTSRYLVERVIETILEKISINTLKDPGFKVQDSACGTGSLLIAWYEILREYHSHEHIVNEMLSGFETNFSYFRAVRNYYGFTGILNESFLENSMKNKVKAVTINPPYSNGMHNKFFAMAFEALEDGGVMTCIHPSNYALTKSERIDQYESRVRSIVQEYESTIEFIDGNPHFKNAHFFGPLCITTVVKKKDKKILVKNTHLNKDDVIVNDINDVYIHGDLALVKSIVDKVLSKGLENFHTRNTKFDKSGPLFLQLPGVCGHPMKEGKTNPDFSCIVYKKDQNNYKSILTNDFNSLPNGRGLNVNSEEEAKNAFDVMKIKFTRFMLSTEKIGQNVWSGTMLKAIPYLDFSISWTPESVYKFFNLSEQEIELIETYIENYYDSDFE